MLKRYTQKELWKGVAWEPYTLVLAIPLCLIGCMIGMELLVGIGLGWVGKISGIPMNLLGVSWFGDFASPLSPTCLARALTTAVSRPGAEKA